MAMMEVANGIFQAIDTIVDKKISNLPFNNTIVCKIIDVSKRDKGEYRVKTEDGLAAFTAYSNEYYSIDTYVYVLIPNNDFDGQKNIVGKYLSNTVEQYSYRSPEESYYDVTGNLIIGMNEEKYVVINSSNLKEICTLTDIQEGLDTLYVKADFKAPLNNFDIVKGTYGLEFKIFNDENNPFTVRFSSTDMLGNPYSYNDFFTQSCAIPIADYGKIKKIIVSLYQDDNFIDKNGEEITPINTYPRVSIKNLYIGGGYAITEFVDGRFEIKSSNGDTTTKQGDTQRTIKAFFIYNGVQYNPTTNTLPDKAIISWYLYKPGEKDEIAGQGWERIQNADGLTLTSTIDGGESSVTQRIKAIIKIGEDKDYTIYTSNILTFTYAISIDEMIYLANSLKIRCSSHKGLAFNIYGQNGELLDNSFLTQKVRLTFEMPQGKEDEDIQEVKWTLPQNENYSMIKTSTATGLDKETLAFLIKPKYDEALTDNLVMCKVKTNKAIYSGSESLIFGVKGSNGTDFTLSMAAEPQPIFTLGENGIKSLTLSSAVTNNSGEIIDLGITYKVVPKNSKFEIKDSVITIKDDATMADGACLVIGTTESIGVVDDPELTDGFQTALTNYLPIAVRADKKYQYIGPTRIYYDNLGSLINHSTTLSLMEDGNAVSNVSWSMKDSKNSLFKIVENKIFPPSFYIDMGENVEFIVAKIEDEIVYIQPIYTYIDRWNNNFLNSWNGHLTLNEKNDIILSSMIGAGKKNSDNAFTGMVIGEVQNISGKTKLGLFGYNNGIETYAFDTSGHATIGSAGKGQIIFDGTQGIIESGSHLLKLDLEKGNLTVNHPVEGTTIIVEDNTIDEPDIEVDDETDEEPKKEKELINVKATLELNSDYLLPAFAIGKVGETKKAFQIDWDGKMKAEQIQVTEGTINTAHFNKIDMSNSRNSGFIINNATFKKSMASYGINSQMRIVLYTEGKNVFGVSSSGNIFGRNIFLEDSIRFKNNTSHPYWGNKYKIKIMCYGMTKDAKEADTDYSFVQKDGSTAYFKRIYREFIIDGVLNSISTTEPIDRVEIIGFGNAGNEIVGN